MNEITQPRFIRNSLFPVTIRSNDEIIYNEVKIIIADTNYYIFEETIDGPTLVEEGAVYDYSRENLVLTTESAEYHLSKSGGCGCGSRLKHFNPFFGVPYGK